ncbi:MAG: class I SAM-dependent methyltransferase [Treponemataceae bacterium]|nr:class I SAM-dependent methyltransferase [Treponemataceae bacterium]
MFLFNKESAFTEKYLFYLKKYCSVIPICTGNVEFESLDRKALLEFYKPDIIHCNDAESFLYFQYNPKLFYSCHLTRYELSDKYLLEKESAPLRLSPICAFYSENSLRQATKAIPECTCVLIKNYQAQNDFYKIVKIHLFYYYQLILHGDKNLYKAYNAEIYLLIKRSQNRDQKLLIQTENQKIAKILKNLHDNFPSKKIACISGFIPRNEIRKKFPSIEFISCFHFSENGILFRPECLPFLDKSFDITVCSLIFQHSYNLHATILELMRISKKQIVIFDKNGIYPIKTNNKKELSLESGACNW